MAAAPGLRLRVSVQPRAARSEVVGPYGDGIKVRVAAPPVDGAANLALIALLAETLRIPRRSLRIVQGIAGRQKVVEIDPDHTDACRLRLEALRNR